jgi:hypothetical protein
MLVYEKMRKRPLKEVVVKPKVVVEVEEMQIDEGSHERVSEASLERIDTAHSRATVSLNPVPLTKTASELEHIDPSNGEVYRLISYKKVESFVPDWIKSQVLLDNTLFMIDRHLYNEHFFNFIKQTLRHIANHLVMSQYQYPIDYIPHFHSLKILAMKIAGKVMFDMQAYYNLNTAMPDITSSISTILTFSDSAYTLSRGDESVILEFLKEYYLGDGC